MKKAVDITVETFKETATKDVNAIEKLMQEKAVFIKE
jgi:hypothetical protein